VRIRADSIRARNKGWENRLRCCNCKE
jgi:hypothetical protein